MPGTWSRRVAPRVVPPPRTLRGLDKPPYVTGLAYQYANYTRGVQMDVAPDGTTSNVRFLPDALRWHVGIEVGHSGR